MRTIIAWIEGLAYLIGILIDSVFVYACGKQLLISLVVLAYLLWARQSANWGFIAGYVTADCLGLWFTVWLFLHLRICFASWRERPI
jgi:hypothetical protein